MKDPHAIEVGDEGDGDMLVGLRLMVVHEHEVLLAKVGMTAFGSLSELHISARFFDFGGTTVVLCEAQRKGHLLTAWRR